jgi:glycosyltransferase involved in cell wall biosynthesis
MPTTSDDVNMAHMTGASNKAFDYLACGMALLVSDLEDWRSVYIDEGYGLACDPTNPDSIVCAVNWFLCNREEMRSMGRRGRARTMSEWNYETQFAPVMKALGSIVGNDHDALTAKGQAGHGDALINAK